MLWWFIVGCWLVLASALPSWAKLYECPDERGGIYMQDAPCRIVRPNNQPLPPKLPPVSTAKGSVSTAAQGIPQYAEYGLPEDVSFAGVKRIKAVIIIPLGYTEAQVRVLLEQAARTIGTREKARATSIFAYRPQDNLSSPYTIGQAIYAPNGRWEDARLNTPLAVTITLGTLYFREEPSNQPKQGDQAALISQRETTIDFSRSSKSWGRTDIIAQIPVGTSITIVERQEFPLTAHEVMIRYLVRVQWQGKVIEGWVHGDQIGKPR
jgi:hypothetical protein